jgi:hypothetical protein
VSREVVKGCVDAGVYERLPVERTQYFAFVDPAGGSGQDSMTLAISHREQNTVVLDAVREWRPWFNPAVVISEASQLLKSYRIRKVVGDHYAGEWCRTPFREAGRTYEVSAHNKGDLYINFLSLLNAARVRLLDHQRLIGQLCSLERRTSRGGRDSMDHPQGGHDDICNAVAGAVGLAKKGSYDSSLDWVATTEPDADAEARAAKAFQEQRFSQHAITLGGITFTHFYGDGEMNRRKRNSNYSDDLDRVARDGELISVPVMLCDSMAGHRPGYAELKNLTWKQIADRRARSMPANR